MAPTAQSSAAAEEVVLLDARGVPKGTGLKSEVHHCDTPLHLAFSLFLFDGRGNFLAQRRARAKKTWPRVWSNSCCGHPRPGEPMERAVRRRARFELGIELGASPRFAELERRWSRAAPSKRTPGNSASAPSRTLQPTATCLSNI